MARQYFGAVLALAAAVGCGAAAATDAVQIERGAYLFQAAGCLSCHTDEDGGGEPLSGGRALASPFGTFYTPNITPHRRDGIGTWGDGDFLRAMKAGLSPTGAHYYPAFPYTAYAAMSRDDILAIKAYLFSRPPVARPNRDHELAWYVTRFGMWWWKWRYFRPQATPTRGAYLARALAHCDECHTPRDGFGGLDLSRRHAGTREGPDGKAVPNITPDKDTGIGRWSADDLVFYFQIGTSPDGDAAGGMMAEVLDNGLSQLSTEDLKALAEYVLSSPPIHNQVASDDERKSKGDESDW